MKKRKYKRPPNPKPSPCAGLTIAEIARLGGIARKKALGRKGIAAAVAKMNAARLALMRLPNEEQKP